MQDTRLVTEFLSSVRGMTDIFSAICCCIAQHTVLILKAFAVLIQGGAKKLGHQMLLQSICL